MNQVLVRYLDRKTIDRLKLRARRKHKSLQQELKSILEEASRHTMADAASAARRIRERLKRKATTFSDSGRLQAEDRRR